MDGYYPIPSGERPTLCKSCGARIVWTKTETGKPIPLDLSYVRGIGTREALTHFAKCPQGREWRQQGMNLTEGE